MQVLQVDHLVLAERDRGGSGAKRGDRERNSGGKEGVSRAVSVSKSHPHCWKTAAKNNIITFETVHSTPWYVKFLLLNLTLLCQLSEQRERQYARDMRAYKSRQ